MSIDTGMQLYERLLREGGTAFPNHFVDMQFSGMSLRDYLAAQALIAVSSRWQGTIGDIDDAAMQRSAVTAYEIADAMLEARK